MVLDVARRRAPAHLRRDHLMLAAQYAEALSFKVQDSGDLHGAGVWVDRAQVWAERARWPDMAAYARVRRSALASTCTDDGPLALEHATDALHTPGTSTRIRGLAAKQAAYGHALAGRPDATHRALDEMTRLLTASSDHRDGTDRGLIAIGDWQDPDMAHHLFAQARATCDVRLGGGESAIPFLASVRVGTSPNARRNAVNAARLARAHAQAGDPDQACVLALQALSTGTAVDSLSTRVELRRTLAPLNRWPARHDVTEVRHQITALP